MPKNIVLITIDSVRADHCLASDREMAPNLSDLGGIVYENAFSNAPYTPLSVPSMLTGRYPFDDSGISAYHRVSLPEYLNPIEYTTGIVYSNAQIPRLGYHHGFDEEFGFLDSNGSVISQESAGLVSQVWNALGERTQVLIKNLYHYFDDITFAHPPDRTLTDAALSWLSSVPEPFFLWVHYMDTHHPYHFESEDFEAISDEPFDAHRYAQLIDRANTHIMGGNYKWELTDEDRQYLLDGYDASIRNVDSEIGRLLDALDLKETSIVVTSDHGEELWDRGCFGHHGSDEVPRSTTLYDEMIHVPLLVYDTDLRYRTVDDPVSLLDVVPTVLDLAGLDRPDHLRGRSLVSDHLPAEAAIVSQAVHGGNISDNMSLSERQIVVAVRRAGYKYIYKSWADDELYHVARDPGEETNVIQDNPELAGELRRIARDTVNTDDWRSEGEPEMDPDVRRQLEELGYL